MIQTQLLLLSRSLHEMCVMLSKLMPCLKGTPFSFASARWTVRLSRTTTRRKSLDSSTFLSQSSTIACNSPLCPPSPPRMVSSEIVFFSCNHAQQNPLIHHQNFSYGSSAMGLHFLDACMSSMSQIFSHVTKAFNDPTSPIMLRVCAQPGVGTIHVTTRIFLIIRPYPPPPLPSRLHCTYARGK